MNAVAIAVVVLGTSLGMFIGSNIGILKLAPPGGGDFDVHLPLQATVLDHVTSTREITFTLPRGEKPYAILYDSDTRFFSWEIHASGGVMTKIYPRYASAEAIQPGTFVFLTQREHSPTWSLRRAIITETKEI